MSDQRTGLIKDVTSFIGRRREMAEVKRLLSTSRLVTLTGVGGVGKTRLAVRVACELRENFPDDVWLVELAQVSEAELLPNVVVEALGVRDQSARSAEEVLLDHLRDRRLLLILDNCEHLLDACVEFVGRVLRATAHVVVLATSREPFGVLGEHIWPVPPMSIPDLANVAPARGGYVYGHEALELFEERARAVQPDFVLDSRSKPVAVQLCRSLDGLPLAIELAAVRMRALSIEQIVARLADRYRLLSTGNRGAPPRHQTLRAAVDWSFDLCSERERTLWARLSVFAGGFDLDAAEAICSDGEVGPDEVFDALSGLIDKSVVLREGSDGGPPRYRLLETIKAYGRERLAAQGAAEELQRRHRDHYLRLAERCEAGWFGPDQVEWGERLRREQANLWTALDFCLTTPGESRTGLRMAGALCFYWNACGHLQDGRYWLGRALDTDTSPVPERAKALWVDGWDAMTQGDNASAGRYFDECLELASALGDGSARAFAQQFRGSSEQFVGNFVLAKELLTEAVDHHRRTGLVNSLTILGIAQLGFVSCLIGEPDRAVELCEECRVIGEEHGELWALSWAMWVCGLARWTQGEWRESAVALDASLRAKHALNDRLGMSACVELLAWAAVEEGDLYRTARLLGASHMLWASIGGRLFGSAALIGHRDAYEERTRRALGERVFEREYGIGERFATPEIIAYACGGRPDRPVPAPAGADRPRLTRRETEVAQLLAEGMTNREIAKRLVISQRTAEGHVEHVLGKLGFRSRAQVAAWFARRDAER